MTDADLQLEAVKAARHIADLARLHIDVQQVSTSFRTRLGGGTLFDLAETHPQEVIALAEGIDDMLEASTGSELPRWMR